MLRSLKSVPTSADIVSIESRADATLRYIRESMDAAVALTVPGSAAIAMGVVGMFAGILSAFPSLRAHWLLIWLTAAPCAAGVGGSVMVRQALLQGRTLFGAPLRKFLLCLLPALLAGAVLTAVQIQERDLHALAGTWLLLYGCAMLAASAVATRVLGLLGAVFFALGAVALKLPPEAQNLCLGAGFGGLHLIAGALLMGHSNHGRR